MARQLLLLVSLLLLGACRPAEKATPTVAPPTAPTIFVSEEPFTATLDWQIVPNHFLPDSSFTVTLTRPGNPTSSLQPLRFEPAVSGQFAWDETATRLSFTADGGFSPEEIYTVTLDPALRSADGEIIGASPTWHIFVATRPTILDRTPADMTLLTDRQPQMSLHFDRPMNQASIAEALQVTPTINLQLQWQGNLLTIQPTTPLNPGTTYHFTLATTATDQEAIRLGEAYQWSYQVQKLVESLEDPVIHPLASFFVVHFNYPVDPTSAIIQITPPLNGQNSWSSDNTVLTYTLTSPMISGALYTVRLANGLRDNQGNELRIPQVIGSFNTPNPVRNYAPAGASVPTTEVIQITFNWPVDQASVEAAFQITPEQPGRLVWSGNRLEFQPTTGYLLPETTYQVTIDNTALDTAGQPLFGGPFHWSFSTGFFSIWASFGGGEHTQIINAAGDRAIEIFFPYGQYPIQTHFELSPITIADWLTENWVEQTIVAAWNAPPPSLPDHDTTYYSHQTFIPADVPPGLYLLTLFVVDQPMEHLAVFISDYTLVAKSDGQKTLVWITGFDGSTPSGAAITLYDFQGKPITTGYSDANGLASFILPDEEAWEIVAQLGNDLTAIPRRFMDRLPAFYRANLTTDRHIYHPGQTLYFRAMVRWDNDSILENVPAGTAFTVELVNNYDYEVLDSQVLISNDFGTANGSFHLPTELAAGFYELRLKIDGQSFYQTFQIWPALSKNIQLVLTTNATHYAFGGTMEVSVLVLDNNGQPLADSWVVINQLESGESDCYRRYNSNGYRNLWFEVNGPAIFGQTDSSGRFVTSIPVDGRCNDEIDDQSERIIRAIQATTYVDNQPYGNFARVEWFRQAESITLGFTSWLQTPGQPFSLTGQVFDLAENGVGNRQLTMTLARYQDGEIGFIPEMAFDLTSDSSGRITQTVTIDRPGYYRATFSGQDVFGNSIATEYEFYVYQPGQPVIESPITTLRIEPNQANYQVGEIAQLAIYSNFAGPALLTFARGLNYRYQVVHLTSPITLVEVPIIVGDTPNLRVTVHSWRPPDDTVYLWQSSPDGVLTIAETILNVGIETILSVWDNHLNIAVNGLEDGIPAGTAISLTIRVTDVFGNPVSAELSLSLVNQLLYDNYPDQYPALVTPFYDNNYRIGTFHSLSDFRSVGVYFDNVDGPLSGPNGDPATLLGNFPDEAGVWLPALYTDANGEVTVSLLLPETAGRWRLSLQAITINTQIGQQALVITTH